MAVHRCLSKKGNTASSSKIIKNGDYTVSILEEYPCDTEEQLLERESYYINLTPNCVNSQCPVIAKDKFSHANYGQAYLKKYGKLTMVCECGQEIKRRNKCVHIKSANHFERMKELEVKEKDEPVNEPNNEPNIEPNNEPNNEPKNKIVSKMSYLLEKTNEFPLEKTYEITFLLEKTHEIIFLLEKMREEVIKQ
jgi:hypothetical protein